MNIIWSFFFLRVIGLSVLVSMSFLSPIHAQTLMQSGHSVREVNGVTYRVFNAAPNSIKLHWQDPRDGERFGYFSALLRYLGDENVQFLTNSGIYGTDDKPAGLHVEAGQEKHALNTNRTAKGNFHLQPNGVFFIRHDERANVLTTSAYQKYYNKNKCIRIATQSGPMLVIDGKVNAIFLKGGNSKHYRSGVCVSKQRVMFFKNTSEAVNFYDFAVFAKSLGCRNALYLDGKISKFYVPNMDMLWHLSRFVGIISVTKNTN